MHTALNKWVFIEDLNENFLLQTLYNQPIQ